MCLGFCRLTLDANFFSVLFYFLLHSSALHSFAVELIVREKKISSLKGFAVGSVYSNKQNQNNEEKPETEKGNCNEYYFVSELLLVFAERTNIQV